MAGAAKPGAGHREIDHTADLGFEVWAPSREGLYAESLRALVALCYDPEDVEQRDRRLLSATGVDEEERLVGWLQEAYLQLELDGWLIGDVLSTRLEDDRVEGEVAGEPLDRERHRLHTEIKAVTYHGLEVRTDDDGMWRATFIVDV